MLATSSVLKANNRDGKLSILKIKVHRNNIRSSSIKISNITLTTTTTKMVIKGKISNKCPSKTNTMMFS